MILLKSLKTLPLFFSEPMYSLVAVHESGFVTKETVGSFLI
jgi:hypothetical protein